MLAEMVRISYQHRAFYCYVILSVWIFLLVAGMYKYIGADEKSSAQSKPLGSELSVKEFPRNLKPDMKTRKIFRLCNPLGDIAADAEGKVEGNLTLGGILVFVRHGDRGPLAHIRNISTVNCDLDLSSSPELEALYQNYQNFLANVSNYSRGAWAQFLGPFHGFPMLPANPRDCRLGQLTSLGVGQLLKTGSILRNVYHRKLRLGNGTVSSKDVVVFSTRYRRTVQSAVALLYALLETDGFQNLAKIAMQESQSYAFCNADCACPAAEKYVKSYLKEMSDHLKSHPAVLELVRQASSAVFEIPEQTQTSDPHSLRDALLAYVCHGASLPCADLDSQRVCVKSEHVTGLFAYTEWEARVFAKSASKRKYELLRAYGLLRTIVAYMLRIISEGKPKVVLFAGHDKTLEYLATALGIVADRIAMSQYASRFVIEVYGINTKAENRLASDFYFRVLVNGRDLTQRIPFCKSGNAYSANYPPERNDESRRTSPRDSRLCPIEAIIRQLHDDYFLPFNATNFKDACSARKST